MWFLRQEKSLHNFFSSVISVLYRNQFSLPLMSFPMIEPGFQSLLRELFHCSPELFHCSPELFRCSPELFHRSPGAFPLQPRNQASKTKCQHSSSLISSIKKRIFVIFERASLPIPGVESWTSRTADQRSSYWAVERWLKYWFGLQFFWPQATRVVQFHFFILLFELGLCIQSKLLENSRHTACYFQWNS